MPARPKLISVRVCIEGGSRRTFASALDWPGWSRSGRGEEEALDTLAAYAVRYAPVVRAAGLKPPDPGGIEIVERLPGSASTDFGVPGSAAESERQALSPAQLRRAVALLEASWNLLDSVVATAPATLRKGPRGGGRDRDAIVAHVIGAEADAYAPKLGIRLPHPAIGDGSALRAQREAIIAALHSKAGRRQDDSKGWSPRYAVRRIAWHVLDHAWEIEDRSGPEPAG
ncbi:MAG: hypothetical protein WCB85_04895 [Candidatus Dormiibacterota bacterium]